MTTLEESIAHWKRLEARKTKEPRNACTGSNKPGQPGSAYQGHAMCPRCGRAAPGWALADMRRGWRHTPSAKEYHCLEAAVDD